MPTKRRVRTLKSVQNDHSGFKANFNDVYTQLRGLISEDVQLSPATLTILIKKCIVLVEQVSKDSGDSGPLKKELVMALMTRLISDSSLRQEDKVAVQMLLETLGPDIIELALEGSVLAKNKLKELFKKCKCCK